MKILSINAGSSSCKFQMYDMPSKEILITGVFERIGLEKSFYSYKINGEKFEKEALLSSHDVAVEILINELIDNKIINDLSEIDGVGHRVVHGGDKYSSSVIITEDVISVIEEMCDLAPLHNPANLMGIRAFMSKCPNAINVAVFDTAFHQTMDEVSYIYPVVYEWYEKYGVRKYGFHGISHNYLTDYFINYLGKKDVNLITCHIGNGGSISAIKEGKCIDTSMGFGPNAGLVMGTRCGDIDTSIVPYMVSKGFELSDVISDMTKKSGLLGISGLSSDCRDIIDGVNNNDSRCILARDLFVEKVVSYIASYFVKLGSVDGIIFTAGVGENSIEMRESIMNKLGALGIKLDSSANNVRGQFALISSEESLIKCYVLPTDEEVMIALDTYDLIK